MDRPFITLACLLFVASALARNSSAQLVQDGYFNQVTYSGSLAITTKFGQFGTGTGSTLTLANWTTTGYNFVYAPGTADSGTKSGANTPPVTDPATPAPPNEAPGEYNASNGYGSTYLWGSQNGGANTLTAPDQSGGNFIAADCAFQVGAITQTIVGLVPGQQYILTFNWAAGQQQSYNTATTEGWQVSLGSQTQNTATYSLPAKGFSGWMAQAFSYTATSASETLSFLAVGGPTGQPPFALLADVSLDGVPEPSSWMLFVGLGAAGTIFEARRRRRVAGRAGASHG